jgi:hypothetical protein
MPQRGVADARVCDDPPVANRAWAELEAALENVRLAPSDVGTVELVVARPAARQRQILPAGHLDTDHGLVGDSWRHRPSRRTPDGSPHPDMQLTVISHRLITLVAGPEPGRRALAGDQLHVDLDLSHDNLPAWTKLAIGGAVIEVTDQPHTGCAKFVERFGPDAMKFVNGRLGRPLRLRGLNARVVVPGEVRAGDTVTKL